MTFDLQTFQTSATAEEQKTEVQEETESRQLLRRKAEDEQKRDDVFVSWWRDAGSCAERVKTSQPRRGRSSVKFSGVEHKIEVQLFRGCYDRRRHSILPTP